MVGKKNVVFGFLFLVFSASLGPYMIVKFSPEIQKAGANKQTAVGRLQTLKADDYEENLDPLKPEAIAKANTDGILALNTLENANQPVDLIRTPHAHGNLESLLNIAVGITLCFIAVAPLFKQAISWIFIVGQLTHSGVMFLAVVFQLSWAQTILNTGVGPALILLGLLLAGVAAAMGFRGELVKD